VSLKAQPEQSASFQWSELSDSASQGLQNTNLVFPDASGYTVYSIEKSGTQFYAPEVVYITKFDASSNTVSSADFMLPERSRKSATLLNVIEGKDKLYFFSNIAVKKDGKNVLYAQVYDRNSDEISEAKEIYTLPISKVNNSGFYTIEVSPDRANIAVVVHMPFQKKTKEKIAVLTLDEALNTRSETTKALSFDSKRAYNETVFVDNNGVVSIVKKTDISKKRPITTVITIEKDNVKEQQISSEGFYISDTKIISHKGKHYMIGFATDNAKPGISVGGAKDRSFFIYNLTDNNLVKDKPWDKTTIRSVLGKGFIGLKVKDVLINNDDLYLIGDCYAKDSEPIEGKNFEYNYTHRFGPGVIVKFDINGNIKYEIPLKYGEDYLNRLETIGSFYPFIKDNKLHVFMNEKESKLKKKKIVAGYRNINAKTLVLRAIEDDGTIKEIPFWQSKTGGKNQLTTFAPTKTLKLSETEFYIYAFGRKSHKFGKMTLN